MEDRTPPLREIRMIRAALEKNDLYGQQIANKMGVYLQVIEVGPKNMPLEVYPDPRYLQIVSNIDQKRLSAACRVTGTHIHLGMPDIFTAIKAANRLREHLDFLCQIGDHSKGERLRLYKEMALNWQPPYYESSEHFFEVARSEGFVDNPRNCWHLIRISVHGTVELRMFGVTEDLDEICYWIEIAKKLIED